MALRTLMNSKLPEHVTVNHETNEITFKISQSPSERKTKEPNGCQVDDMIRISKIIIEVLNRDFHSEYNDIAIDHLRFALIALNDRKKDRENRGVEGLDKK